MGRHGKAGAKQRKQNAEAAAVRKSKHVAKGATSGSKEESGQNGHAAQDHSTTLPPPPAPPAIETEPTNALAELLADDATFGGPRKRGGKSKKTDPPPKKPGETKAQYEARINAEPAEPLPPGQKHRPLHIDPAEFEEEEPEKDETNDDYSDTQNERGREYKKGGYHPVLVGELYHERYRVVHKLGWGYFSTVWLVWDYKTEKFQAMKVQKSADHYRDAAFDEIKLLSQIMGADPTGDMCCARMTDSFEHKGPHGVHVCMLFDVLGENLLSLIERYENRGVPIPIVKSLARETLIGLHHIHSIGIIHTDIKPENVLLSSPKHKIHRLMRNFKPPPIHERPSLLKREVNMMTKSQRRRYYQKMKKRRATNEDGEQQEPDAEAAPTDGAPTAATTEVEAGSQGNGDAAAPGATTTGTEPAGESETDPEWEVERFHHACLADFGNSCWVDVQFTDEVQTRQYRAPEVIIGDPYSTPIDLWSAACMFFELLTGEFLFDPKGRDDYPRDEDHLALITELLGPLPAKMRCGNGKFRAQFYDSHGNFRHIQELRYWSLRDVLHEKYRFSRKKAHEIANFLLPMLVVDPEERATALEMLTHFEDFFEVQEDDYSPLCYRTEAEEAEGEDNENEGDDELEELLDHEHGPHGRRLPGGEEPWDQSSIDDDFDSEGDQEESSADDGREARTAEKAALKARPGNSPPAHRKAPHHRAHRPSRHVDPEHERHIADAEWYLKHPILAPQQLALHGLTIDDIKTVLADQKLSDPQKHVSAERIVSQLVEQENAV